MSLYTGAPSCTGCGGSLQSDGERCWCGGSSQYVSQDTSGDLAGVDLSPEAFGIRSDGTLPSEAPRDMRVALRELERKYAAPWLRR